MCIRDSCVSGLTRDKMRIAELDDWFAMFYAVSPRTPRGSESTSSVSRSPRFNIEKIREETTPRSGETPRSDGSDDGVDEQITRLKILEKLTFSADEIRSIDSLDLASPIIDKLNKLGMQLLILYPSEYGSVSYTHLTLPTKRIV